MKVVIYQPSFIPWLGYFDLFLKSDVFVFYDDVQFTKRDWRTRNRVRTDRGWSWIIVPVRLERPYFEYRINEVRIDYSQKWIYKHLKTFEHYYKRSRFYGEIMEFIEKVYEKRYIFLKDFILELFMEILKYLECGKKPKIMYSHSLNIPKDLRKTDRLVYIIKEYIPEASEYLTGPTAKNYLDERKFTSIGVKVVWHEYDHPYYDQLRWGTNFFISHLSILDLLFNHGKDSCDIITKKKIVNKPSDVLIINANDLKNGEIPGG